MHDLVRARLIYTDIESLKKDLDKLLQTRDAKDSGFFLFRLQNKLASFLSNVQVDIMVDGVATEIQLVYYLEKDKIPLKGTIYEYRENVQHWAYQLTARRIRAYPMETPFSRLIEDISQ
jgi:hypothetical protein